MKMAALIIGVLIILAGATFFLQGVGILPGSYMTGQLLWAIIGFIMLCAGAWAIYYGWPRRRLP